MQSPNGDIPIKYRQLFVLVDKGEFLCDSAARCESLSVGEETSAPASAHLHRVGDFLLFWGHLLRKKSRSKVFVHLFNFSFTSQMESKMHSKGLVIGFSH